MFSGAWIKYLNYILIIVTGSMLVLFIISNAITVTTVAEDGDLNEILEDGGGTDDNMSDPDGDVVLTSTTENQPADTGAGGDGTTPEAQPGEPAPEGSDPAVTPEPTPIPTPSDSSGDNTGNQDNTGSTGNPEVTPTPTEDPEATPTPTPTLTTTPTPTPTEGAVLEE